MCPIHLFPARMTPATKSCLVIYILVATAGKFVILNRKLKFCKICSKMSLNEANSYAKLQVNTLNCSTYKKFFVKTYTDRRKTKPDKGHAFHYRVIFACVCLPNYSLKFDPIVSEHPI